MRVTEPSMLVGNMMQPECISSQEESERIILVLKGHWPLMETGQCDPSAVSAGDDSGRQGTYEWVAYDHKGA